MGSLLALRLKQLLDRLSHVADAKVERLVFSVKTRDITPQVRAFLLQGARMGKVATVGPDRLPHVIPVWFHLDGDDIIFITGNNTMKAKNLRHEDHVAMCVDDEHPPYAYAEIEGTLKISDHPKKLLTLPTALPKCYT